MSRLVGLVKKLAKQHGSFDAPVHGAYELILLEQVAYLADDATRLTAFRLLEKSIGLEPESISAASEGALKKVTRAGGAIAYEQRAKRLRFVADRVIDTWGGNLSSVLELPYDEALRELMKYPSIGKPGAERILLLTGTHARLALDSNAMRVLLRLGYGRDEGAYAKTYALVQAAAERELPPRVAARRNAHLVLRAHGQTLCRRSRPLCEQCPVHADCPTGRALVPLAPKRAKRSLVTTKSPSAERRK